MIWFNGMQMTLEEFNKKKKEVESQSGYKIVEIQPNKYVTRIQG